MPNIMLLGLFLFLVLAPCLLAFDEGERQEESASGLSFTETWRPRLRNRMPAPLNASLPESTLSEDFVIRSFAKGLAQRRLVVRDGESGVKLNIGQVRAAAAELLRISGQAAAFEFALVTARAAAAMAGVRNALEIAAYEAIRAAREAYAWFAWTESEARPGVGAGEHGPPLLEDLMRMPPVWREQRQAA